MRVAWTIACISMGSLACSGTTEDSDGSGGAGQVGGAGGTGGKSGTGGATALDCPSLSEAECKSDKRCQERLGYRVDEDLECREGAPVYFGCHAPGCPASIHVAEDPSGELWLFYNGCTPEAWLLRHDVPVSQACDEGAGGAGGQK